MESDQSDEASDDQSRRIPVRRREFIVAGSVTGVAGCLGDDGDDDEGDRDPTDDDDDETDTDDTDTVDRFDPAALLLTWQADPTETMTIDWHTDADSHDSTIEWRQAETDEWSAVTGDTHRFDLYDRTIHRVELTGLTPDTTYEFKFADEPIYRFQTLPAELSESLTFAVGGDADGDPVESSDWAAVASQLIAYDPQFFVIAGDLAYADGGDHGEHERRWQNWLSVVKDRLVTDDNRVVPIVAGIGNHECVDGYYTDATEYANTDEWRESFAPYFYNFFAFPGHPGYDVLDIGDYLSLPILDTDHTSPVVGEQTDWLADVLSNRSDVDHVIPIYHVPAYPSERSFSGSIATDIREHWVPLFEAHDVGIAFEHHDHAHKITYPLRNGDIDPTGVVYVGDGPLGYSERDPGISRWYLNRTKARYNGDIVTIDPDGIEVMSVDIHGRELQGFSYDGGDHEIEHYPNLAFEVLSDVIQEGDTFGIRIRVANATPIELQNVSVSLEGVDHDFDFSTEDTGTVGTLEPDSDVSMIWEGTAPNVDTDVEVVTRVQFTVDGVDREEFRSDWIPVGF